MSIKGSGADSAKVRAARAAVSCVLMFFAFCADSPLLSENTPPEQQPSSSGHELAVLLDVNGNQRKVLAVELSLAEGVIENLGQPGNMFSVITFGSQPPVLLKSRVHTDEALATIRNVSLEQTRPDYLSVRLYEALNLGFGQFTDDTRPKSLLIIAEGNDASGKSFKPAVSRAKQLHITCNVALVADHTFYGSKAIQRYGFYLRELAAKTHGRYIEVGARQKKVSAAAARFANVILAQDRVGPERRANHPTRN